VEQEFAVSLDRSNIMSFRQFAADIRREHEDKHIVFLLDEVDELLAGDLAAAKSGQLFRLFRSLSQTRVCQFVFSGSRNLFEQLRNPRSPFFNFCKYKVLRPLEPDSVADIVLTPMGKLGVEIVDKTAVVERIIDITSCHPNLTQYICDAVLRSVRGRSVSLADVDNVLNGPDFMEYYVSTAMGESTSREDSRATSLEELLTLLVEGPVFSVGTFMSHLGVSTVKKQDVEKALEMLEFGSLLERKRGNYRFALTHYPRIVRECSDVPSRIELLKAELAR
jgi:hypothetical protein